MASLQGKTVAVTGGSAGIGRAIALAFAREGCRLALCARHLDAVRATAKECEAAGAPEVLSHGVDVRSEEQLQAWVGDLGKAWSGRADIVVANAGVGHYGPFLGLVPEQMQQVLETNVLGVWRTVHAFGPMLRAAKGRAVVVSSVAGKVPVPYLSTYSASKAALIAWSRAARPDLARDGVRLTVIDPGFTATDFGKHALRSPDVKRTNIDDYVQKRGWTPERVGKLTVRAVKMNRREVDMTLVGQMGIVVAALAPHFLVRMMEPTMRPKQGGSRWL
ncbi:MAG: SDR family NAD(P)-dependent oxidoreductase [Halobacteriales archaeon]|nr:SDR family NAD(P)-dependent oxidoreductase [Halobacteriales archaeon]